MKKLLLGIGVIIIFILLITLIKSNLITHNNSSTENKNVIRKQKNVAPKKEKTGVFTDKRDDKSYKWIRIDDQVWMAENFAFKPSEGKYWAYNNDENNIPSYGYLYDWQTAQNIAPEGWHLPSKDELKKLVEFLGDKQNAYQKLIKPGIDYWGISNKKDQTGFDALPSGYFDQRDNSFNLKGEITMFHSTTESSSRSADYTMGLVLNKNFKTASIEGRPKTLALPVRFIKD